MVRISQPCKGIERTIWKRTSSGDAIDDRGRAHHSNSAPRKETLGSLIDGRANQGDPLSSSCTSVDWIPAKIRGIDMPVIKIKESESFEGAMKRFKKTCEKAGILTELRRREYYDKPSIRKKKKEAAARKRALKKIRRSSMN